MIRHLCKLVWNRKRANALTAFQIFISFLILFIAVSLAVDEANNYRQPRGFSYENRWVVFPSLRSGSEAETLDRRQVYQALEEFDWIESVASANAGAIPYGQGRYGGFSKEGKIVWYGAVSDEFHEVLDLELVSGRWFSEEDAALDWEPLVITQPLSEALFGGEDPIGQQVEEWQKGEEDARVIGVVADYRRSGELSDPGFFLLTRLKDDRHAHFLVKVRPGTPLAAQEQIDKRLKAMAPGSEVEITTLEEDRALAFKLALAPLFALGVVSVLVMGMVALSLSGVLWQRTTLRTEEIGLRRALGGSAASIYAQLTGEMLVVASIGVIAGLLLVLQFPLLELLDYTSGIYALSLALAALIIYGLVIVCSLYPGRLACRIRPVEALHHE
jgi:putative ABC transport system permease protein